METNKQQRYCELKTRLILQKYRSLLCETKIMAHL